MIAKHDVRGFLPAGIHSATWDEFEARFATTSRRVALLRRVRPALRHFAAAGARFAIIGGSFVTTKAQPNDIDVAIETAGLDIDLVNPILLDLSMVGRATQKAVAGAEFFPAEIIEGDTGFTMAEFFQHSRDGEEVGVVRLDLSTA